MKANEKAVVHYSLCFQELTVFIKLPEKKSLQKTNSKNIIKMLKVKNKIK